MRPWQAASSLLLTTKNICFSILFCFLFAYQTHAAVLNNVQNYVPDELLVQFNVQATAQQRLLLQTTLQANASVLSSVTGLEKWKLPANSNLQTIINQLIALGNISYAEPNYQRYPSLLPTDPLFNQQWALSNTGQLINDAYSEVGAAFNGTVGVDMKLPTAWANNTGSTAVVIAVLDDGVDMLHPDLAANIWLSPTEVAGDGLDNDLNGFIDDIHGWDFYANDADPSGVDIYGDGHGTAVAGVIGAVGNNGLGIAGVNWTTRIMPLRISLDVASEIAAIDYAIAQGVTIVNISFGGGQFSQAELAAFTRLQAAGILVVAAAGNNENNNDDTADYPSSYDLNNILSVAASTANNNLSTWSQFGLSSVDLAAPGTSIYTTLHPATSALYANNKQNGLSYGFMNGSSMSAPYVAGIAGLIKTFNPAATAQEMKGRIMAAAGLAANQLTTSRKGLTATGGHADATGALSVVTQPVLVIRQVRIDDLAANNNGQLDAGETVNLWVDLENIWQNTTVISATLSSADLNVTINNPTVTYPNLATGANTASATAFNLSLAANLSQHYRLPLSLTINATNYTVTRPFEIEIGGLMSDGRVTQNTIQLDGQDDVHYFHVQVPTNMPELVIATTSAANIDLSAKFGSRPAQDAYTLTSARSDGMERISILTPSAGTYFIAVSNTTKAANTAYTIQTYLTGTASTNIDTDGDQVSDASDAFPTDIAASLDSDNDHFPNNWTFGMSAANSTTGLTHVDAFNLDPAASLDTDADGHPDNWNPNASTAQIAASALTIDAYPLDVTRWIDVTAPVVTAPIDLYVTLNNTNGLSATDPRIVARFATASALDDVDIGLAVSPYNAPALFPIGSTLVNFIATDKTGNAGFASSLVVVSSDTRAPVVSPPLAITVAATNPTGTLATDPYITTFLNAATALDNIDGVLAASPYNAPTLFAAGTVTPISFHATDAVGNLGTATANITIAAYIDVIAPILTLPQAISVTAASPTGTLATDPYITAFFNGASALDNVDGALAASPYNAPTLFAAGSTTAVTFQATDAANNLSSATANVTVLAYIDHVAPVLTVPANITIAAIDSYGTLANDASLTAFFNTATALDNVDGNLTVMNTAPVRFPIGATIVDFYATDAMTNQSLLPATVTVLAFVDTIAPVVQAPNTLTLPAVSIAGTPATHVSIAAFINAGTATDNLDPSVTVNAINPPTLFQVGATPIDFYATDIAGNTGVAVGTVVISPYMDVFAPTINLPVDIYVASTTATGTSITNPTIAAFLNAATTVDNMDPKPSLSNNAPQLFVVGTTVITFNSVDNQQNASSATANIRVDPFINQTPPVVTAPNNITVSAGSANGTAATLAILKLILASATAVDDVDPYTTVTHNAPATFPVGTTTVTYAATDSANNTGSATSTVTVSAFIAGAANILAPSGTGLSFSQSLAIGIDPYSNTLDSDGDGILDWVEIGNVNAPTDTDLDGLPDVLEAGNNANNAAIAKGMNIVNGTVDIYSAGQTLTQVAYAPLGVNAPISTYSFPYGNLSYATTVAVGQSTTIRLTFSSPLAGTVKLFKVDMGGNYIALPASTWVTVNGNTIDMTLTDGDPLTDLDGVANGVIVDPVSVAIDNIPVTPVVGAAPFIQPPGKGCLLPAESNNNTWFWLLAFLMIALVRFAGQRRE
ncbi:MAG: S8 family serine peptidase [Mariprofundaceae bacterium]|nr:S8 family serine peptidase [Mariprofundaceae bacterium]